MIIYGTRATHLSTEQMNNETCPNCGTQASVFMSLSSKYAHIFWIPVFPYGKYAASQCQNCKQVLEVKEMPQGFKNHLEEQKAKTKTPIWHFSGLAVILALAVWIYISGENDKKEEQAYLASPQVSAIYEMKTGTKSYTTFKIVGFENDSIIISYNLYETNKMTGISDIDKPENYDEEDLYLFSKNELLKMYEEGTIYDINRD